MGVFITVDGPNGVGKTTFISKLEGKLKENKSVYVTREPSETDFGQYVKNNEGKLSGEAYAFLIAADRSYHIENFIKPKLKEYDIVICDRYIESSLVLQCYDGCSREFVWKVNEKFLTPDISIVLTASASLIKQRLEERERLTAFERIISREEELRLYEDAYSYLLDKGFNCIKLCNDDLADMSNNVNRIVAILKS